MDAPIQPCLHATVQFPGSRATARKAADGSAATAWDSQDADVVMIDVPGGAVTLPVKEVLQASWYSQEPGTVLDKGRVVFDYLV